MFPACGGQFRIDKKEPDPKRKCLMRFLSASADPVNSVLIATAPEGTGDGGAVTVVGLTNYPLAWLVIVALDIACVFVVWGEQHNLA